MFALGVALSVKEIKMVTIAISNAVLFRKITVKSNVTFFFFLKVKAGVFREIHIPKIECGLSQKLRVASHTPLNRVQ